MFVTAQKAYKRGMVSPTYVWIFPSWYNKNWWNQTVSNASCTPSEMLTILNNTLGYTADHYLLSDNKTLETFSGLVCSLSSSQCYHELR